MDLPFNKLTYDELLEFLHANGIFRDIGPDSILVQAQTLYNSRNLTHDKRLHISNLPLRRELNIPLEKINPLDFLAKHESASDKLAVLNQLDVPLTIGVPLDLRISRDIDGKIRIINDTINRINLQPNFELSNPIITTPVYDLEIATQLLNQNNLSIGPLQMSEIIRMDSDRLIDVAIKLGLIPGDGSNVELDLELLALIRSRIIRIFRILDLLDTDKISRLIDIQIRGVASIFDYSILRSLAISFPNISEYQYNSKIYSSLALHDLGVPEKEFFQTDHSPIERYCELAQIRKNVILPPTFNIYRNYEMVDQYPAILASKTIINALMIRDHDTLHMIYLHKPEIAFAGAIADGDLELLDKINSNIHPSTDESINGIWVKYGYDPERTIYLKRVFKRLYRINAFKIAASRGFYDVIYRGFQMGLLDIENLKMLCRSCIIGCLIDPDIIGNEVYSEEEDIIRYASFRSVTIGYQSREPIRKSEQEILNFMEEFEKFCVEVLDVSNLFLDVLDRVTETYRENFITRYVGYCYKYGRLMIANKMLERFRTLIFGDEIQTRYGNLAFNMLSVRYLTERFVASDQFSIDNGLKGSGLVNMIQSPENLLFGLAESSKPLVVFETILDAYNQIEPGEWPNLMGNTEIRERWPIKPPTQLQLGTTLELYPQIDFTDETMITVLFCAIGTLRHNPSPEINHDIAMFALNEVENVLNQKRIKMSFIYVFLSRARWAIFNEFPKNRPFEIARRLWPYMLNMNRNKLSQLLHSILHAMIANGDIDAITMLVSMMRSENIDIDLLNYDTDNNPTSIYYKVGYSELYSKRAGLHPDVNPSMQTINSYIHLYNLGIKFNIASVCTTVLNMNIVFPLNLSSNLSTGYTDIKLLPNVYDQYRTIIPMMLTAVSEGKISDTEYLSFITTLGDVLETKKFLFKYYSTHSHFLPLDYVDIRTIIHALNSLEDSNYPNEIIPIETRQKILDKALISGDVKLVLYSLRSGGKDIMNVIGGNAKMCLVNSLEDSNYPNEMIPIETRQKDLDKALISGDVKLILYSLGYGGKDIIDDNAKMCLVNSTEYDKYINNERLYSDVIPSGILIDSRYIDSLAFLLTTYLTPQDVLDYYYTYRLQSSP